MKSFVTCAVVLICFEALAQPTDPNAPIIISNPDCGPKLIGFDGSPSANEEWYWQGNTCGSSFDFMGTTYACGTTGTYYLRAYNTVSGEWSAGCSSIDVVVNGTENSSVSGIVSIGAEPCVNCKLLVYKHSGANGIAWTKVDSVQTDPNGHYERQLPGLSTFVVCARPETGGYINCAPTYAGNIHRWGPAQQIVAQCDMSYTSDISVVTYPQRTGACTLTGQIRQINAGKTLEEDPIPLIDVVIERTPPGSISGMTQTDSNGEFTFDLVEADAVPYLIRVSIPGLPMQNPILIPVNPGDLQYGQIDYCVDIDTTYISPCTITSSFNLVRKDAFSLSAMPNPAGNRVTVMGDARGKMRLVACDLTGREEFAQWFEASGKFSLELPLESLAAGVYNLSLTGEQGAVNTRIVKE